MLRIARLLSYHSFGAKISLERKTKTLLIKLVNIGMVDRGRWLGNFIKSIVLGFCAPCARSIVENSIVLLLFYYCFTFVN